ncbi:MAG: hypothetical protein K2M34_00570 [Alphaproteobacteria bacterium]|nr:hypothetical protein [Alphaproteobacteria bacterium]
MKKLIQKTSFASLMLFSMAIGSANAAGDDYATNISNNICELVTKMGTLFGTLRTLAFIGAAFIIAGWAWGYISKPGDLKLEDVKTKGMGMLVGFILLFSVGVIISVFMDGGVCESEFKAW